MTGFRDGGGHVIYQVGARAQCGNCALATGIHWEWFGDIIWQE